MDERDRVIFALEDVLEAKGISLRHASQNFLVISAMTLSSWLRRRYRPSFIELDRIKAGIRDMEKLPDVERPQDEYYEAIYKNLIPLLDRDEKRYLYESFTKFRQRVRELAVKHDVSIY